MSTPERFEPCQSQEQPNISTSVPTGSGPQIDRADTTWARWKNWTNAWFNRFDEPTILEFIKFYDDYNEARDIQACEKNRDYLLKWSPQIRFMQEKLQKLGADLNKDNIKCMKCTAFKESGFDPSYGIQLCANRSKNQGLVEDCMAHEMIHAYDHLRWKVDWDNNLRHAACTEIRASSLSGECRFTREFFQNGQRKFANQHQRCVKRRAQLSLMARPICKDEFEAAKAVNDVWESCFADTRPFDEIYK